MNLIKRQIEALAPKVGLTHLSFVVNCRSHLDQHLKKWVAVRANLSRNNLGICGYCKSIEKLDKESHYKDQHVGYKYDLFVEPNTEKVLRALMFSEFGSNATEATFEETDSLKYSSGVVIGYDFYESLVVKALEVSA